MYFYKIWDADACEDKILSSNKKWSEEELEELIKDIQYRDEEDFNHWHDVVDILVNEYEFNKLECEFEVICDG